MNDYSESLTGTEIRMARDLDAEFEAQLSESSRLAFRIAYGVLRHREDAEDVAQEAMAKAYRSFGGLRERNRFRPWLVRIVWRLAIDHKRACKRRSNLASASAEMMQIMIPDTDPVVAGERAARLWQAIDALPEKLRLVTVLAGIEEHDTREVASLLSLPEGTVKSRLFLARQRLKELLQ
jgi:RNA polymerase sigma-70 factor (ECF subfamily)